jgi:hypothetical protein
MDEYIDLGFVFLIFSFEFELMDLDYVFFSHVFGLEIIWPYFLEHFGMKPLKSNQKISN